MKPRLLVVSTVHPADDPRIRHKLIATLQDDWVVTFAGKGRGPIDQTGIRWVELGGGRVLRWLRAARLLFSKDFDVASLHDPELLPLGIVASRLGRSIVFDVHENVPAQFRTKEWVPRLLRKPLASLAGWLLRVGERRLAITLAEASYSPLFANPHPVFPNYLAGSPPRPRPADPATGIVYLGDVTEARGLALAVEAVGAAGADRFTVMGRCTPDFKARLLAIAETGGVTLQFRGFVTSDEALRVTAGATMGLSPLLDTPNYRVSLPTKVLEYLAVGVPTLASDLPGTREVVGDKPGVVLIAPGDVQAWRDEIAAALDSSSLRTAARKGVAAIRDAYVWPAEEVRDFYAGCVNDR
ncbi:MAG: glycosyltransferase family 4 protein [bacterium]|nr:glycosyltransferase family 4 protein [bacterium]MCP4968364.1 glycosyltransferase family 4 protein [bacterium]